MGVIVPPAAMWIALSIIFVVANIWSEENVRFGYVLVPLVGAFFVTIKWISFSYLGQLLPVLIVVGIIAFLRSQLRLKYGFYGSGGSLLWKIISFVIFIQFAIIFVNGLAVFNTNFADNPSDAETSGLYSISSAESVYGSQTYGMKEVDVIAGSVTLFWTSLKVLWSLAYGFFMLWQTMPATFHIPTSVAVMISAGIYLMTAFEVFTMIYKPLKSPEI